MHRLSRADADQDAQDFHTVGPLRHRWIKAVTTLLDGGKVECRGIGDRLKELRMVHVIVGPGNGRMLASEQSRNRLWKLEVGIKIRVMGAARGTVSTSWCRG